MKESVHFTKYYFSTTLLKIRSSEMGRWFLEFCLSFFLSTGTIFDFSIVQGNKNFQKNCQNCQKWQWPNQWIVTNLYHSYGDISMTMCCIYVKRSYYFIFFECRLSAVLIVLGHVDLLEEHYRFLEEYVVRQKNC